VGMNNNNNYINKNKNINKYEEEEVEKLINKLNEDECIFLKNYIKRSSNPGTKPGKQVVINENNNEYINNNREEEEEFRSINDDEYDEYMSLYEEDILNNEYEEENLEEEELEEEENLNIKEFVRYKNEKGKEEIAEIIKRKINSLVISRIYIDNNKINRWLDNIPRRRAIEINERNVEEVEKEIYEKEMGGDRNINNNIYIQNEMNNNNNDNNNNIDININNIINENKKEEEENILNLNKNNDIDIYEKLSGIDDRSDIEERAQVCKLNIKEIDKNKNKISINKNNPYN